ncbi:MAG: guanylate kinase [Gammaproteobacteria bacterium]
MPKLIVISAPSGAGKTSLIDALLNENKTNNLVLGISYTTRKQRSKEIDGQSYFFISIEDFQKKLEKHEFLENAEVFGNRYGTSREWVSNNLLEGSDVLLELDWQGAMQVKEVYPQAITIFVLPPSIKELERRLKDRKQDSEETISRRILESKEEILRGVSFDFLILNNSFEKALNDLNSIISKEEVTKERKDEALSILPKLLEDSSN